jgi:hypothetical protein
MGGQEQIIDEIMAYIHRGGGKYQDWFVGITDNPISPIDEALLSHEVDNHRFIYLETISQQVATAAADYFVNVLGTDGNLSKDNRGKKCHALYVYKKSRPSGWLQNQRIDTVSQQKARNTIQVMHPWQ